MESEQATVNRLIKGGIHCQQDADGNWEIFWSPNSLGPKAVGKTIRQAFAKGFRLCWVGGCSKEYNHPDIGYAASCEPAGPNTRRQWQESAERRNQAIYGICSSGAASN